MKREPQTNSAFSSLSILRQRWKEGTFGEILDDWGWIFSYSKKYKGAIIFYTLLGITSTTLGLVAAVASKYMIDIITGYKTDRLWQLIALTLASAGLSLAFSNIINRISTKLSININNDIQADIFDQIIDADWLEISRYSNGDVLNRFHSDVGTVSSNAIGWLPTVIISAYNFIATFLVIWHYSRIMSLLAFATAPVMLLMSKFLIKKQREYARKMKEMGSGVMTFEVETFYNMDTIKSFGIAPLYGKKLREWQAKYREMALKYNMFTIKTNIFMSVLGLVVQYSAFGYCLFLLWTRQITYGTMTLFLQQRSHLEGAFKNVVSIVPSFLNSSISAHRIREIAQLKKEVHLAESLDLLYGTVSEADAEEPETEEQEPVSAEDTERKESKAEELLRRSGGFEVRMDHVDFSYIPEKRVISDSDFEAKPGEIVALVGPSGEGKTTVIRLLLGLVRPESGRAYLKAPDGTEVEANAEVRPLFAYVPQGNTILSGTIADNLRMVKEDASDEEVIEALKTSCAWDFVKDLPKGIDSPVGERGRGLSEGQAQRVAIARAVLRDAPILLLDEATSALDVATERNVLRNLVEKRPSRTCIVTTHRPTVLNLSDRVYRVMETHVTELTEEESSRMAMDF